MLRAEDEIAMFLSDDTILKFGGAIPGGEKYNGTGQESRRFQQYKEAYEAYGELGIVYENDHVLIVNKPVGMLTQKAAPSDRSLNEWLIGYLMAKGRRTSIRCIRSNHLSVTGWTGIQAGWCCAERLWQEARK